VIVIVLVLVVLTLFYGFLWMISAWLAKSIALRGHTDSRLVKVQEHFGILVAAYSVVALIVVPSLFYFVYEDRLLEGMVASVALLWFLRTQLPTLLSPSICTVFHHWKNSVNEYDQMAAESDQLTPGAETFLNLRLVNVGLTPYEACACSVTLPPECEIVSWKGEGDSSYSLNDYAKPFKLQKQNNCARFPPDPAHTLHPGDSVWYPILIRPSAENRSLEVKIEFATKSCWSAVVRRKSIKVANP
jgi:hypothetical protein